VQTTTNSGLTYEGVKWVFDDSPLPDPDGKGERAVAFIKALRHPKSTLPGHAFQLDRWMERIVRRCIGDTDSDGVRKIKTVFLMVGRGNRKTTLAGALSALFTFGPERTPGGRAYSVANSREQASICFDELAGIVRAHPRLVEACTVQDTLKRVTHAKSGARYGALSSEAKNAHGLTPAFALVDELHEFTKPDLYDAIKTGLNKTAGSLLFIATTAGVGQTSIAYDVYQYALKVQRGEIVDPSFLPIIFQMEKDDDWQDEAMWHRTNPGLAYGYPDIDGLRNYVRECEYRPGQREAAKRLHFGQWLDGAAEPAWDMAIWDQNANAVDLDELEGARAWLAIDLSKQTDLSAVGIAIERPDNRIAVHVQAFAPEEGIRRRAGIDAVPYPLWRDQGLLTACPGDVVDRGMIEAYVRDLCERFDVQEINFDRWSAREMMEALDRDGMPVVEFPQTIGTFTPAINAFERGMFERRLEHGGNPLLRWAVSNVVLYSDASGNRRPDKKRAPDRIDPAVCAIMACGRALAGNTKRSAYDTLDVEDLNF
jgi:phage terminase large subunit-like protein